MNLIFDFVPFPRFVITRLFNDRNEQVVVVGALLVFPVNVTSKFVAEYSLRQDWQI